MIPAPIQKTELMPSGFAAAHDDSAGGTWSEFVFSRAYRRLQAATICPTASVTISGFSLHDPDEDPVDEADARAEAEAGEQTERQPVVLPEADADDQVACRTTSRRASRGRCRRA